MSPLVPLLLVTVLRGNAPALKIARQDFFVPSEAGIQLFVREVAARNSSSDVTPILLIHGARVPGLASFDLDVPGGSLAAELAGRGLAVYVMDVRGFGGSTRPQEMSELASEHASRVRSNEAAHDIGAVVDWISTRRHVKKVALFGWATGGQWAGYYASFYPEKVSVLILLNSMYGGSAKHPMMGHGSDMEDPQHPGQFNASACGSYRFNTEKSLFAVWDRSIPVENNDAWRDPAVGEGVCRSRWRAIPPAVRGRPRVFPRPAGRWRTASIWPSDDSCGMRR